MPRKVTGINLDPDVVKAIDDLAAKLQWSRSKLVNYILREGVSEASDVMVGLADLSLDDLLKVLSRHGDKVKRKKK